MLMGMNSLSSYLQLQVVYIFYFCGVYYGSTLCGVSC
ncbi:Uncharacterised protein [Vibrio cholerae]|nr:Uncharacterised protein [Vibrio cholerae]